VRRAASTSLKNAAYLAPSEQILLLHRLEALIEGPRYCEQMQQPVFWFPFRDVRRQSESPLRHARYSKPRRLHMARMAAIEAEPH